MIDFSVTTNLKEITRQLNKIERSLIPKANVTALNKTADNVKTKAVQEISKITGFKQKIVRKQIKIFRASRTNFLARLIAIGEAVNLIEFVTPAKTNAKAFRKRKGVTAKAWGKTKEYKGTFIAPGKSSGKFLVFARTSKGRYPIEAKWGPSVPHTFIKDKVNKAMKAVISIRFPKHFDQALRFHLSRLKR